jgi:DNA-binding transcriptional LysR family regulator
MAIGWPVTRPGSSCGVWRAGWHHQASRTTHCGTSIPLERLSDVELLLPAPGTALRAEIDSATGPARIVLRPAMELDGVRLIASLAFDGYGAAILPATAVPGNLRGR